MFIGCSTVMISTLHLVSVQSHFALAIRISGSHRSGIFLVRKVQH